MLVKYIRNRHGHPYGAVVAVDPKRIGWSLCHVTAGEVFRKDKALMIAENRALAGYDKNKIPHSIRTALSDMEDRAKRYFQGVQL